MDGASESGSIPTNVRLLYLLEELARIGAPSTPTELNERLGLPKPTVHRLCATLEEAGFLSREIDGRRYSPGARLRALSLGVMSSAPMRSVRLAVLSALSEDIGETCNISVPDGDGMIYLDRVETKWPLRIQLTVGARVPLHCTAAGKMYLASLLPAQARKLIKAATLERRTPTTMTSLDALETALEQIRERGYSQDDEEFIEGMVCVAVPVRERNGRLCATLSFHAPTQRMSMEQALAHAPRLHAAAKELATLSKP